MRTGSLYSALDPLDRARHAIQRPSIHLNVRTSGRCRKVRSWAMIISPSGSIQRPNTGKKENTPPATNNSEMMIFAITLSGSRSHFTVRHSQSGR